jgi:hypothetical protein
MTFEDIINDIEKMVGLKLQGIGKNVDLTLTKVDKVNKRIEIITSQNIKKTRPFSEFKKIWDALCTSPAIHVDSIFKGSGSSRNQPETIIANLPYVEWLFLDGTKHLALMKDLTHDYGTLSKMNEIKAVEIKDKLKQYNTVIEVIIVTDEIREATTQFEVVTGVPLKALSSGIYEQYKDNVRFIIASKSSLEGLVDPGTYIVVSGNSTPGSGRTVSLNGREYTLLSNHGLNLFVTL